MRKTTNPRRSKTHEAGNDVCEYEYLKKKQRKATFHKSKKMIQDIMNFTDR